MIPAVLLSIFWLSLLAVAVLTWPGYLTGARYELAIAALALAGTISINVVAARHRAGREPVFAVLVHSYWFVYLAVTIGIVVLSAESTTATTWLVAFHVINLAIAIAVAAFVEVGGPHIDDAAQKRRQERSTSARLIDVVRQLRLEASGWPVNDQRPSIEELLKSIEDVVRFSPRRVESAYEQSLSDAIAVVDSTTKRLSSANGQPPMWYVSELTECQLFIRAQLNDVVAKMSSKQN